MPSRRGRKRTANAVTVGVIAAEVVLGMGTAAHAAATQYYVGGPKANEVKYSSTKVMVGSQVQTPMSWARVNQRVFGSVYSAWNYSQLFHSATTTRYSCWWNNPNGELYDTAFLTCTDYTP
jgi:hypothetical protein